MADPRAFLRLDSTLRPESPQPSCLCYHERLVFTPYHRKHPCEHGEECPLSPKATAPMAPLPGLRSPGYLGGVGGSRRRPFTTYGRSTSMSLKVLSLRFVLILLAFVAGTLFSGQAVAQPLGGTATTESVCNFGMAKDEPARSCEVPIPHSCRVAKFPGTDKHWTNVSKGGNTTCQFDEKKSDWKTRITGSCGTCKSQHCSVRFSVMFNCGSEGGSPQFTPQSPVR